MNSVFMVLVCAGLAGCAGSATAPVLEGTPVASFNAGNVAIGPVSAEAAPGVAMQDGDLSRMTQLVQSDLATAYPQRVVAPSAGAKPGEVNVHMVFTNYDPGNAFARFMLAGLGQIHIAATVKLIDANTGALAASYDIEKTFAWGGMYGGSTTIEDVQTGFAASVVNIFKAR